MAMPSQLTDAKHWRDRAREMRAVADGSNDIEVGRAMYQLADDYDKLAGRAEQRNSGSPRPPPSALPKEREP